MISKKKGINCFVVNSSLEEYELDTGEKSEVFVEVNITTEMMLSILKRIYLEWEELVVVIKPLQYEITRNNRPVLLKTNAITFAARKQ